MKIPRTSAVSERSRASGPYGDMGASYEVEALYTTILESANEGYRRLCILSDIHPATQLASPAAPAIVNA